MVISLVIAVSDNHVIGEHGKIPWHLPADMLHFKDITLQRPIIMGRKTYDSIGHALAGRHNIVVTHQDLTIDGCDVTHSLQDAIHLAEKDEPDEICIIGGGEIYRESLPLADKIYLTRVHGTFEGDVTFPSLSHLEWRETSSEFHDADDKNPHPYTFITYKRR